MATAKKADETKKVTKATPAAALAKVEAVKKEEAAKKTAATETKAAPAKKAAPVKEEPKAAPAKKTAPAKKEETKAAAPAKKATAKKAAPAKTTENVFVEFAGGQIKMAAIVAKVKEVIGNKTVKELNVYYQPETGMVYYTADGEEGICRAQIRTGRCQTKVCQSDGKR